MTDQLKKIRHAYSWEPFETLCGGGRIWNFAFQEGEVHTYVMIDDDLELYPITCEGCLKKLKEL